MESQGFPIRKLQSAFPARERLLVVIRVIIVNLRMSNQVYLPRERFSANGASEGRFARVQTHVSEERSLLQKLLSAGGARVRDSAVQSAVIDQLELSLEGRAAVVTDERM